MKRCPKCLKFNIEYDPVIRLERCLWWDCGWVNIDNRDLDDENYSCNFSVFRRYLETKIKQTPSIDP